jgi:ParB family chromosome partitioning protein
MAEKRPALGRGLSALIPPKAMTLPPAAPTAEAATENPPIAPSAAAPSATARPTEIDLDRLVPNPRQPRAQIDEARLEELAQSIRANGVIQPVIVRRAPDGRDHYEIVAGERRWRAAQRANLLRIPVVVRDVRDEDLLQVALIENIQRDDLNPIEEANAYRRLIDEHKLSQEAVAIAVGKDRATVANYMRLLRLPEEVRANVATGAISMGHARAIVGLTDDAAQRRVAREVMSRGLSVRETEAIARREANPPAPQAERKTDPNTREAENRLRIALGTRVRIARRGKGGRIEIDFTTEEELQRLYEMLTGQ